MNNPTTTQTTAERFEKKFAKWRMATNGTAYDFEEFDIYDHILAFIEKEKERARKGGIKEAAELIQEHIDDGKSIDSFFESILPAN